MSEMNVGEAYLIQDSRSYVGNAVLWWCDGGAGYTTDIDKAGRFTKEKAETQHRHRKTDVPYRLIDVAPLAIRIVDMQKLRKGGMAK